MKLESLPKSVVDVISVLSKNEMLGRLLVHDVPNPYNLKLEKPDPKELMNPNSSKAKIFPYPFDPEAMELEGSFIRVYYNSGDFNENEVIAESKMNIDIIVSKNLWLINDGRQSLIRPYDIAGRIVDLVGTRSIGKVIKLKFEGYSHLYINTKYDCIRLYAEYMSVES